MAILGTFSSFTAARLGIYASQAQLQVTGNNIANINTRGYTRQRGDLFSLNATGLAKYATGLGPNVGYGVLMDSVSQLRDPFLDIRFRNQNTKTAEAEATLAGLRKIAQTLDEVNKGDIDGNGVIEKALKEMLTMLRLLSDDVGSEEYDSLVREAAKSLTTFFNTAADKLERDWDLQKGELEDTVKSVNKCLTNIRDLNEQIRKQGIYGDNALELRDQRNLYIDELSSYLGIDVEYSMERIDQYTEVEKLTIYLKDTQDPREGPGHKIKLVDGLFAAQLSFSYEEEINPQYNAAQPQTALLNPKFDPTQPESETNCRYLDENGKGTNDINKANMVMLNPRYEDYPRAINPKYLEDATQPKYLDYLNQPTDDINAAARVRTNPDYAKSVAMLNPAYDEKANPSVGRYLKADGTATDIEAEAARVMKNANANAANPDTWYFDAEGNAISLTDLTANPPVADADAVNTVKKYLKTNGEQTDSVEEADKVGRYLNKDGKETNIMANAGPASRKYMTADGGTTNDPDLAAKVEKDPKNPKKFLLQVERLEDKFGVPMNRGKYADEKESVAIPLNDTELQGAIQAMRELLTEEGEFASYADVGLKESMSYSEIRASDPKASLKKGIPYYQRRLDLLAQEFAKIFNEHNQMSASRVYESTPGQFRSSSQIYETGSVSYVTKRISASSVYYYATDKLPGSFVIGYPHDCFLKAEGKGTPPYDPSIPDSDARNHIDVYVKRGLDGTIISISADPVAGASKVKLTQTDLDKLKKKLETLEEGSEEYKLYEQVYKDFIAIAEDQGRPTSGEGQGCFLAQKDKNVPFDKNNPETYEYIAVKVVNGQVQRVPLNSNGTIPSGSYYLTEAEVNRAAASDYELYKKYVELLGSGVGVQEAEPDTSGKDWLSGVATVTGILEVEVFIGQDGEPIKIGDKYLTRDMLEKAKSKMEEGDRTEFDSYMKLLKDGKTEADADGEVSMTLYEDCFMHDTGLKDKDGKPILEPIMVDDGAGGEKPLTRADLEKAAADNPAQYLQYMERIRADGVQGESGAMIVRDGFLSKYGTDDNPVYVTKDDGTPLTRADLEAAWQQEDKTLYTKYLAKLREEGTEIDVEPRYFWNKDNGMYIAVRIDEKGNVVEDYENGTELTTDMVDKAEKENPALYAQYLEILREHGLLKEEYNYYDGGVLFSNSGDNNDPTHITAKNISISHDWSARIVRILNTTEPNEVGNDGKVTERSSANDNILHLIAMFEKQLDYKAADLEGYEDAAGGDKPFFHGSFQEMYTDLGATLGMEQNTMDGIAYNYEVMTLDLDNDRISVYGVDLNDEATSMMQFQKSYQAACKLLTTLDSMLDTLINGTLR